MTLKVALLDEETVAFTVTGEDGCPARGEKEAIMAKQRGAPKPQTELDPDQKVALLELALLGVAHYGTSVNRDLLEPLLMLTAMIQEDVEMLEAAAAPRAVPAAA